MPSDHQSASVNGLKASSDTINFDVANCTVSWVQSISRKLDRVSRQPPTLLPNVLSPDTCIAILSAATKVLSKEATLVAVKPPEDVTLTVVGDLHGAYHDFLHMLHKAGEPSPTNWFIFNGACICCTQPSSCNAMLTAEYTVTACR